MNVAADVVKKIKNKIMIKKKVQHFKHSETETSVDLQNIF